MEFTIEKSREEAEKLKMLQFQALMIDDEYLKAALKDMRENHSMRDSIAILNPNPLSHNQQQDLNEAKLNQLELIIKLKDNIIQINNLSDKLNRAKKHENEMKNIFGG